MAGNMDMQNMSREDMMRMSEGDLRDMARKMNMQNADNMGKEKLVDAIMRNKQGGQENY